MSEHPIEGIMGTTLEKIKSMVDVNTIIGEPMEVGEGITLIPISKVSFGFASGGSDFPPSSEYKCFGGGSGAGVSVIPVAFIVVQNNDVKIININTSSNVADKAISMIPEVFDKISSLVKEKKCKKQKSEFDHQY